MIELQEVTIEQGEFSLRNVSFRIETKEYVALMGRTGRGKTTILEAICGLRKIRSGRVLINDQDVSHWSPGERKIGYVPQDLALFPTMTVREHLEFAVRIRRQPRSQARARALELAPMLGIEHLLDRRVRGLSGGESQRVALGRALSFQPSVLLLDEPLSALDAATRQGMQELLSQVRSLTNVTVLHVTHNQEEADHLADRCLSLDTIAEI